jgi:hypothetical protein
VIPTLIQLTKIIKILRKSYRSEIARHFVSKFNIKKSDALENSYAQMWTVQIKIILKSWLSIMLLYSS